MGEPHFQHGRLNWWIQNVLQNLSAPGDSNFTTVTDSTYTFPESTYAPWRETPFKNLSDVMNWTCVGASSTTSCNNSSSHTEGMPVRSGVDPTVIIYAASFLIVFCTVSLTVNIVILCSVCFMRTRVYPTLYISLSLAGADTFSLFFFALGLVLFSLLPRLGIFLKAPCIMLMIEALRMGAILTTMFHLAALAGNHYLGILQPLHYPVYMARRNIQYCIIVLWTVPSSLLILDMFYLEGDGFHSCPYEFLKRAKFRTRFSIPFFTTLGMMIFIYLHIYKLVRRHQTQPLGGKYRKSFKHSRVRGSLGNQVNEKAIITTLMIVGSTFFGWTPAFTYFALFCEDCLFREHWNLGTAQEFVVLLTVNFLLICKTATNSYIYAFRMKEIKIALRRMRRRVLMRLFAPQRQEPEWAVLGLTRTTSRQSTSRSRTFVYRMNSYHEPVCVSNGSNKRPGEQSSLRRCRSANTSRNKHSSTSV